MGEGGKGLGEDGDGDGEEEGKRGRGRGRERNRKFEGACLCAGVCMRMWRPRVNTKYPIHYIAF